MKRLTGLDAGFLSMETPSSAMHVSGLAIYDPVGRAGGPLRVEDFREMVRARLHLAPPFRQRLVQVPFQLHFPLWIEDPDFDLDNHIRRVAVPAPGGTKELNELVSQLNALQLDRSKPLWEVWYIEGLEGDRVATLTKVHHCAIDGASGSEITVALFDLTPEVAEHPPAEPWEPDTVPSDMEMLTYATQSLVRQPLGVLRALRRTAKAALDVRSISKAKGDGGALAPLPFTAPPTSVNGSITSARSIATISLSLDDVKRVKNAFGATVNDVVLALCAGTLRSYFERRGEELEGPLLAMVPVSVRSSDQRNDMGNQVSSMFASLATDLADPVERLAAIHDGMKDAKEQQQAIGADTLTNWSEFAAPAVFGRAMRLYARMGLADRHRPIFNLTISNVPGPPFPLYSAGAKLEANFPLGPIFEGAALNITVMSLENNLDFGIVTCPDVVDDVESMATGLQAALDELLAAANRLEAEEADAESSTDTAAQKRAASARRTDIPGTAAPAKRPTKAKKATPAKNASAPKRTAKKATPAKKAAPAKKRATTAAPKPAAKKAAARKAAGAKKRATTTAKKTAVSKRRVAKKAAASSQDARR